jgi:hypothetical protein
MVANGANDMRDAWALWATRAEEIGDNMDNENLSRVDIDDAPKRDIFASS